MKVKKCSDDQGAFIGWRIECPACNRSHIIDDRWGFNNNLENPTFTPSLLVKTRHPKGYSNDNPAPRNYDGEYVTDVCHSFIRDGRIEFLSDCTHDLAGKTVELPEIML